MSSLPAPIVSAVVERGAISNRIAKVRRRAPPRIKAGTVSTTCIGVSLYLDELAAIDAAVQRIRDAGVTDMNRSRLIRIAVRRLDTSQLVAAVKELR